MQQPIQAPTPTYVLYDGWCSVCVNTASHLTKLDKGRGCVECIDFRVETGHAASAGIELDVFASSLHARTPDGGLHSGPEAIRVVYEALGRKRRMSWTSLPVIRPIVDACYRVFARNRLRWFSNHTCTDGSCSINDQDQP